MLKKLIKSDFGKRLIVFIAYTYIRFVWATSRVERVCPAESEPFFTEARPFILAFWHSRILLMPYHWVPTGRKIHMLISQHNDGELIARAVRPFGVEWVPGSSRRGGKEALYAMIRLLRGGDTIGITPDGPKGPRQRVKPGIIHVAKLGRVPILPVTYAVKRRWVAGSWDRFVIALPFNRIYLTVGQPLDVTDLTVEAASAALEVSMNDQMAAADAHFGFPATPPGAPLTGTEEEA